MEKDRNIALRYLEIAARWYVFITLSIYGYAKLFGMQFYRPGKMPPEVAAKTAAELSGFELAWTFFGYSYGYIFFIGFAQVSGALLLLSGRTKLLGTAILIPILLNIIVADSFFGIHSGALLGACYYLLLLLLVLFLNREKVFEVLRILMRVPGEKKSPAHKRIFIALYTCIGLLGLLLVQLGLQRLLLS